MKFVLILFGLFFCVEFIICRQFDQRDCSKPPMMGTCSNPNSFTSYYWDEQEQKCKGRLLAMGPGCQMTKNSFERKRNCRYVAGPICSTIDCMCRQSG
ncbi:unnamed protein product [Brassicogethes aeneus]|uniref:BPTI/Kunitz inhibitor domain-containing protein n=1 Tax=Brassicogethes aeneus TaxID=1431903 RepID=A0A9P0FK00_BRAAE|nr:unnamed protein product [Brassicogethes aeneus]